MCHDVFDGAMVDRGQCAGTELTRGSDYHTRQRRLISTYNSTCAKSMPPGLLSLKKSIASHHPVSPTIGTHEQIGHCNREGQYEERVLPGTRSACVECAKVMVVRRTVPKTTETLADVPAGCSFLNIPATFLDTCLS